MCSIKIQRPWHQQACTEVKLKGVVQKNDPRQKYGHARGKEEHWKENINED